MADFERRRFIQTAAAASMLAGKAQAQPQAGDHASRLQDIDHIIVLMKENRSFDHYFGALRGVRGFDDPRARLPGDRTLFQQVDALHPDGHLLPFRLNTFVTSAQRLTSSVTVLSPY